MYYLNNNKLESSFELLKEYNRKNEVLNVAILNSINRSIFDLRNFYTDTVHKREVASNYTLYLSLALKNCEIISNSKIDNINTLEKCIFLKEEIFQSLHCAAEIFKKALENSLLLNLSSPPADFSASNLNLQISNRKKELIVYENRKCKIEKKIKKTYLSGLNTFCCYSCKDTTTSRWRKYTIEINHEKKPPEKKTLRVCNKCGLKLGILQRKINEIKKNFID
jgi:hypothetical protein